MTLLVKGSLDLKYSRAALDWAKLRSDKQNINIKTFNVCKNKYKIINTILSNFKT